MATGPLLSFMSSTFVSERMLPVFVLGPDLLETPADKSDFYRAQFGS